MHLKDYLIKTAKEIREIEAKAESCLGTEYSKEYDELMLEKAKILLALHKNAKTQDTAGIKNLDETMNKIHSFSKGANTAIKLGSRWYMSALLYPDDHVNGTPNNLEKCIEQIEM